MAMPKNLVLIRHGQSEANVIQKQVKSTPGMHFPDVYKNTPDREVRLSDLGREQTKKTGEYLASIFPNGVDVIYVSDHTRAKETAALTCIHAGWKDVKIKIDPQIGERNWGHFEKESPESRDGILSKKKRDPLHAPFPNGETMLHTRLRTRNLLDRCARQHQGQNILVFSHGEYIECIWSEIANMRTEEQKHFFESPSGDIKNCQVVEFKSDEQGKLTQVKTSNPFFEVEGEWGYLDKKSFTPEEILAEVALYPSMIKNKESK